MSPPETNAISERSGEIDGSAKDDTPGGGAGSNSDGARSATPELAAMGVAAATHAQEFGNDFGMDFGKTEAATSAAMIIMTKAAGAIVLTKAAGADALNAAARIERVRLCLIERPSTLCGNRLSIDPRPSSRTGSALECDGVMMAGNWRPT